MKQIGFVIIDDNLSLLKTGWLHQHHDKMAKVYETYLGADAALKLHVHYMNKYTNANLSVSDFHIQPVYLEVSL